MDDDDDGGFAVRPENRDELPESGEPAHTFTDVMHVEPVITDPAPQLGGGAPDAIFDAFRHYTEDDAILPGFADGVMLAQGTTPPTQEAPLAHRAPSVTKPKKKRPAAKAGPKKQRDDWDKVKATTDGAPGGYDIGWMKNVDPRVLASIDGGYADDVADVTVAQRVSR